MRILFLITDLHLGGSPLVVAHLATGLRDFSLQHSAFSIQVCSLAPITFPTGEPTQVAAILQNASISVHTLGAASSRQLLPALARYRALLKTLRPDLVYSVLVHANLVATLGKLTSSHPHKLIQSIHTLQPKPAWHWTLQGQLLPFADGVVAPSQPILDKLAQFGPFQNARVIPNGIDVSRFATAASICAPKHIKTPSGWCSEVQFSTPNHPDVAFLSDFLCDPARRAQVLVAGYVGRFDPVKRLDLAIRALTHLDDRYHLVLVGYGPAQASLQALATSLHLAPRVHFVGPTVHPERWYKSFDINVLPSPVEGFGLTIVESLAAGTPVAAFRTPATAALIRPGIDGALAAELSERALALAIKEVAALRYSPGWSPQPSQSRIAAEYSLEAMIQAHCEFLRKFS